MNLIEKIIKNETNMNTQKFLDNKQRCKINKYIKNATQIWTHSNAIIVT